MVHRFVVFVGCLCCALLACSQTVEHTVSDSLTGEKVILPGKLADTGKYRRENMPADTVHVIRNHPVSESSGKNRFMVRNTDFWLLPWGNRPIRFSSFPFSGDYSVRSMWKGFHTLSSHTTYPLWGSVTYIRFLRNIPLTTRFSLDLGWYFSGYTLPVTGPCWDFGGVGAINYDLSDRWRLQMLFDYSALEHSNMLNPLLTPMYPHSKMEMNIQFMPVQNVKLKVGYDVNGR